MKSQTFVWDFVFMPSGRTVNDCYRRTGMPVPHGLDATCVARACPLPKWMEVPLRAAGAQEEGEPRFPLPLANHHPFLQGALRAQK